MDDYAASTATTGRITVGSSVTGSIEAAGDRDWFAISLQAGQSYIFTLAGSGASGLFDPYLLLYSGTGSLVTYNDDGPSGLSSRLTYTATTSGTYYLAASSSDIFNTLTGNYTLTATLSGSGSSGGTSTTDDYAASASTSGRLSSSAPATGRIDAAGDADWFAVTLTAGQAYTIKVDGSGSSPLSDPYLRLYNSSGSLVAYDDDSGAGLNAQLGYTPSTSGTYYVAASSADAVGTGNYTVSLSTAVAANDDYAASTATTGRLAAGSSASGVIEKAGDADWFAMTLTAGQTYTLNLNPGSSNGLFDPYLRLYGSSGTLLASDDDSGPGLNSQLSFTPTSSGTYYAAASSADSASGGSYTLLLAATATGSSTDDYSANSATTGRVSVGGTASGRIETAGDADWFAVTLSAGQTYSIGVNAASTGGLADPYLRVYNAAGSLVAYDDDNGAGLNALATYTPTASGTYYIAAQSADNVGTGSYAVTLNASATTDDYAGNAGTTGRLTAGGTTTGRIETGGDTDWFSISLNAGQTYSFNLNAAASGGLTDPYLRLYDNAGALLSYNDDAGASLNSTITYTATRSGTFYLGAAGALSNATGAYSLSASGTAASTDDYTASSATSGRLAIGGSSAGRIEAGGDADWFALAMTAGQTYTIKLDAASSGGLADPYLRLYSSSGSLLTSNDDFGGTLNSQITYTPASSGTFYASAASASSSGTGNYMMSATTAAASSDDYAASSATIGRVTAGSSTTGRIETGGDNDWFAMSLTAGTTYTINLNTAASSGLADPYLRLYGSSGTLIASNDDYGGSLNAQLTYTPTTSGTFYASATSSSANGTGNYLLALTGSTGTTGGGGSTGGTTTPTDDYAATTATGGRVSIGSATSGRIETVGDRDWFAVSLTAGQSYTFSLAGSGSPALGDPYLSLYNSNGSLITSDDDGAGGGSFNSRITYTPTSSGTFYLGASGTSSSVGSYTLGAAQSSTGSSGSSGGSSGSSGGSTGGTGSTSGFHIDVRYTGDPTYRSVIDAVVARWESVITGDLPDARTTQYGTIDDLLIEISIGNIDGRNGTLAYAGPTLIRNDSGLPIVGRMVIDSSDVASAYSNGSLSGVLLHEMGHIFGLGTLWEDMNLIASNNKYAYIGTNAVSAYRTVAHNTSLNYVPLESTGGEGTAGGHWSEAVFDRELMTGWIDNNMPMSIVTIAALADLGYVVNLARADPFSIS